MIDLGDLERGERTVHDVHVFNLDPAHQAGFVATIEGHPSIKVISYPDYLPPSHDTAGAGTRPIRLELRPNADPVIAGTLKIGARWNMNARPDEVRDIPVVAVTHPARQPTVRERAASEAAERERTASMAAEEKTRADIDAGIADYHEQPKHEHHDGHLAKLVGLQDRLRSTLVDLANSRQVGVTQAAEHIGGFIRAVPIAGNESLLQTLVWAALDWVSGPVSSAASATAASALKSFIPDGSIAKAVESTLKDGIKGLGKKITTALVDDARPRNEPTADSNTAGNASRDARALFIAMQSKHAWEGANDRAAVTAQRIGNNLRATMLDTSPVEAFRVVEAAIASVKSQEENARAAQASSTMQHWIRYLAQTSMGTVENAEAKAKGDRTTGDGSKLTNMDPAAHAPDEHRPMQTFDGLVDVRFSIDETRPQDPAKLESVTIRGVRNAVAKELANQPISTLRTPLRAFAAPRVMDDGIPRAANVPLAITRDEAGNYQTVDNLRLPWEEPRWLSRKAGMKPSAAAQLVGARLLLEQELVKLPQGTPKTDGED